MCKVTVTLHMALGELSVHRPGKVRGEARDHVACALCDVGIDVGVVLTDNLHEMVLTDNLHEMTKGMESRPIWPFGPGTGLHLGARVRLVTWT